MERLENKNKVIIILIAILLIAGIITTLTIGLNFDLLYQNSEKVELYLEKEFEISDIKQITDEVFGKEKVIIQKVEVYEDMVSITAKSITDEQKENLITKINEKYEVDISKEDTEIKANPHMRGRDIIKPYILPFVIASILVLVYVGIRYFKLGIIKTILESVGIMALAQALLLSIISVTRIPIGIFTPSMIFVVYIISILFITKKFEKDLKKERVKEEKSK